MTPNLSSGQPASTPLHLVPLADVRTADPVDYHMHTTYTDGTASVHEMAEAALSRGIGEVLFSEHVRHTSTLAVEAGRTAF